ncbi:hypothetical protein [Streptomyces sp. NPDC007205]|uniref:hypothetical protein n=1 Tax=Streptomyces sp. NPDC007205 TaxID=3154316 RepID=UPI0033F304D7
MTKHTLCAATVAMAVTSVLQIADASVSSAMPKPIGGKTTVKSADGRIYYDLGSLNPQTQTVFRKAIQIWNDKLVGKGRGLLGVWNDLTPAEKVKLGGSAQIKGVYQNWTDGNVRNGTLGYAGPNVDLLRLDMASFDDQTIKRFWDRHYGPRFNYYPMVRGIAAHGLPQWHLVRNFDEWRNDVWKGNMNTVLHEMGHTLGLDHPQKSVRPGEVMRTGDLKYPQVDIGGTNWPESIEPDPGEVDFVRKLYRSEIRNLYERDRIQPGAGNHRPLDPSLPHSSSDRKQGWDPVRQSWVPYAAWHTKYGLKPYLSADGLYGYDPDTRGWELRDMWNKKFAASIRGQSAQKPDYSNWARPSSDWKQGWDPVRQSWVPYAAWHGKYESKPYLSADGWYIHDPKAGWVRTDRWKKESKSAARQQSHKDIEPASRVPQRDRSQGRSGQDDSHSVMNREVSGQEQLVRKTEEVRRVGAERERYSSDQGRQAVMDREGKRVAADSPFGRRSGPVRSGDFTLDRRSDPIHSDGLTLDRRTDSIRSDDRSEEERRNRRDAEFRDENRREGYGK